MFKLAVSQEELQEALADYYKGSVALAKTHAETLYEIAYAKIRGTDVKLSAPIPKEEQNEQLSYLESQIPLGLTKDEYVELYTSLIEKRIKEKLSIGDLSDIRFPSKRKVTVEKMLDSEEEKFDRIYESISEGFKDTDWRFWVFSVMGFFWPGGMVGMAIANFSSPFMVAEPNTAMLGFISGGFLFSSLVNIPNFISFAKTFISTYKEHEKLNIIHKYYSALNNLYLSWNYEFFKTLANEFRDNYNNGNIQYETMRNSFRR